MLIKSICTKLNQIRDGIASAGTSVITITKAVAITKAVIKKKVKVTFSKQDYTSLALPESHQLCSIYHANVNGMRILTGF